VLRSRNTRIGLGLASLLLLAGCGPQWGSDREQYEVAGRTITVLDNPEETSYGKTEINELVRLDDVRGNDWLSDDKLLVDRENREMKPERVDGLDEYPRNVYVHDLSTGFESPLAASMENQGFAMVSPDRTKVFFKTFSPQSYTGQGHISDLVSGISVSFTYEDAIAVDNGRWVDNDSIVYSTIQGKIYEWRSDLSQPRILIDAEKMFPGNLAFLDRNLFFTTPKGDLIVQSSDEKVRVGSEGDVVWMIPSPDEQRLAIVNRFRNGKMVLRITDLQGNVLQEIAQDSQIFGLAWSPDGNRIAYAGITPNGTVRGIHVADVATGKSTLLSLDVKFIADPLRWNPSGNRLMVTSTVPDEQQNRNRFVTYLVRVP